MDIYILMIFVSSVIFIVILSYAMLRNFTKEIIVHIDILDKKMNIKEKRCKNGIESMDEKIFWLLTEKKLEDVISEKRMKRK